MESKETLFPEEIYLKYLSAISGIKFTPREIDIIACVLHGKSTKGIANFLSSKDRSIGDKAVETHTLNIRRKIAGNARESIIKFIEKSDKYQVVRSYYESLLIQKEFRKILSEFSPLIKQYTESFSIIVDQEQTEAKAVLIKNLHDDLKVLATMVPVEKRQDFTQMHIALEKQHRIYIISQESQDVFEKSFIKYNQNLFNTVFLISNEKRETATNSLSNVEFINLEQQKNYYSLFFLVLIKLFPNLNIEEIKENFKKRYNSIQGVNIGTYSQPIGLNNETKENHQSIIRYLANKNPYFTLAVVLLIFISTFLVVKHPWQNDRLVEDEYELTVKIINKFADVLTTDQTSTQYAKDNHSDLLSVQQAVDNLYNKYPKKLSQPELQSKFNYLSCVLAGHYRYNNDHSDELIDSYLKSQYLSKWQLFLATWFKNLNLTEFHDYVASTILERVLEHYNTRYGISDKDSAENIKNKLARHAYALEDYILLNYYLSRGYMSLAFQKDKNTDKFKSVEKYLSVAFLGKEFTMFETCSAEKNKLIVERDKIVILIKDLEDKLKKTFGSFNKQNSLISIIHKLNSEKPYEYKFQKIMEHFLTLNSGKEVLLKELINGFTKLANDEGKYINHYRPWKKTHEEFLIPKKAFFNIAVMIKENLRTQAVLMSYYNLLYYNDPQKLQKEQKACLSNSLKNLIQFLEHPEISVKWEDTAIQTQRKMIAKAIRRLGENFYDQKVTMQLKLIDEGLQKNKLKPEIRDNIAFITNKVGL